MSTFHTPRRRAHLSHGDDAFVPSRAFEVLETVFAAMPQPRLPGAEQPWDGYDPPCTLKADSAIAPFPVQKASIEALPLHDGIEAEGDEWMRLACDVARLSVERSGGPFGAVLLQVDTTTNRILRYWIGHNQVVSTSDPTAHAEVVAIRAACSSLGVFDLGSIRKSESRLSQPTDLSHCILYSSAEPCPMCYAAIRWAHLAALRFAATRFDAAAPGVDFSDAALYDELSRPYAERPIPIHRCATGNALDAFNLWKRSEKTPY